MNATRKEIPITIIEKIKNLIEEKQNCQLNTDKCLYTYWLRGDNNEFRISQLGNFKVIISRVEFEHKRKGTMSAILQIIKEYCKREGIATICIQSVETEEMVNFCNKNGLIPDEYATIDIDGMIFGDYLLRVERNYTLDGDFVATGENDLEDMEKEK